MPRSLVLHQITVMDLPVLDFVRMAGGSGCDAISLFTNSPDVILPGQSARFGFPAITGLHKREALSHRFRGHAGNAGFRAGGSRP